ncbi:MAG: hypothetical protein AB1716_13430 [Planctomycetota bacterium]
MNGIGRMLGLRGPRGPCRKLLVMAVTRLSDGVCVACLDEENRWVRPTRLKRANWRQLELADLRDAEGRVVVAVGNEVEWELDRPAPLAVHSEDVLVGRGQPRLVRTLPAVEFLERCGRVCDHDLCAFLRSPDRSLTLIRPERLRCLSFSEAGKVAGKPGLTARIYFVHQRLIDDFGVTDLGWRAFGRTLLAQRHVPQVALAAEALADSAGLNIRYLAIGRGQPWEEKRHPLAGVYWPFFVTVITEPPLAVPLDFANL